MAIELQLTPTARQMKEQACRRWVGGCDAHGKCVCSERADLLKLQCLAEEDLRDYLRRADNENFPVDLILVRAAKRFIRRVKRIRRGL